MKKMLAMLLAVAMIVACFAGCQSNAPVDTNQPADSQQPTDSNQPTDTTAPEPVQPESNVGPDGREFADEQVYRTLYSSEVTTMNYLVSGTTYELVVGANTIDSLVENDPYGNIVPCAAESWESEDETVTLIVPAVKKLNDNGELELVSERTTEEANGQKWTFHLRAGQYWYDADGNQKDPVTANDYVAAARYVCDSAMDCSNSYLMDGWIVNATERLGYTAALLAEPVEQGKEEGKDQDIVIDADGVIWEGKDWDEDKGVYTTWVEIPLTNPEDLGVEAADDNTLVYHLVKPRPYFPTALQFGTYWPAPAALLAELGENYALDNYSMWFNGAYILSTFKPQEKRIYTKNVNNWDAEHIYIESIEQTYNAEASTIAPELFLRGEVDYADIGSDIVADWLSDPEKSQMISSSRVTGDYSYFFGFNFEPTFDAEYEPENWVIAVNNENFRKAVFHGIDRDGYLAAKYPGDDPEIHKINTITPKGFSVNNGKDFVMYGGLAKYTETESFNEQLALEYRDKAKTELEAAGCKFPIKVPINYNSSSGTWGNATVVLEQQLENLLGADFIDIIVVSYSGNSFLKETRRNGNYALQELNWGADFMDPETWADPFERENSYNFFCHDTDTYNVYRDTKTEETNALIDQYYALVDEARTKTGDMDERFEAFAAAESFYIDHAIVVPGFISGGSYCATKLNGFEGQYAMMGQSSSRYKGQHLYKTAMSQDMFDAQYNEWYASMGN
ncbi:MAG: peptide ABC transporter substrate-binding protein [Clostridiales bacterium]|nr:peptide ABC transporter substrate-binding protein [Clostridiales bacterium]